MKTTSTKRSPVPISVIDGLVSLEGYRSISPFDIALDAREHPTRGVPQHHIVSKNVAGFDGGGIYNQGTLEIKGDTFVARNAPNDIAP